MLLALQSKEDFQAKIKEKTNQRFQNSKKKKKNL